MLCGVALQLLETALDKKSAKGGVVTEWQNAIRNLSSTIQNVSLFDRGEFPVGIKRTG
jgi:hypothetical protein